MTELEPHAAFAQRHAADLGEAHQEDAGLLDVRRIRVLGTGMAQDVESMLRLAAGLEDRLAVSRRLLGHAKHVRAALDREEVVAECVQETGSDEVEQQYIGECAAESG